MGMLQPVGGNSADVDYLRSEEEKARRARVYKTGQNRGFASSTVLAGPDERNLSSAGSFQAVEAAARALDSDGHLVIQANGTVSAVPDYPSLVR